MTPHICQHCHKLTIEIPLSVGTKVIHTYPPLYKMAAKYGTSRFATIVAFFNKGSQPSKDDYRLYWGASFANKYGHRPIVVPVIIIKYETDTFGVIPVTSSFDKLTLVKETQQ